MYFNGEPVIIQRALRILQPEIEQVSTARRTRHHYKPGRRPAHADEEHGLVKRHFYAVRKDTGEHAAVSFEIASLSLLAKVEPAKNSVALAASAPLAQNNHIYFLD